MDDGKRRYFKLAVNGEKIMSARVFVSVAIVLLAVTQSVATASAQQYPVRPIRMLVPFAPGGATDIIARILEPRLSQKLGQQVVVDNRSGAAGNIAVEIVATAAPDGYTLLVGNISTNSINPLLFSKNMSVNALKDLAGVTQLVAIPNFVLGSPKVPANTLKEAMDYARSRNGQLNYGAPLGSYSHLDMLALTQRAGVKMLHIPTKGAGETLTNLIRGDAHINISNVASNVGPVRSGQIKAYAVTTEKRLADFPNIPSMGEAGFAGIGSLNWNGIFAPVKTPRAVVDRVFRDTIAAMKELEAEGLLAKRQLPIALSASPKEYDGYVLSESKRWEKIIRDNKVVIE